jgi:hypothetical protein
VTTPDMHSRDLGTLADDGPQLTQFETPGARATTAPEWDIPAEHERTAQGQSEALGGRPQYSPVAQPGMVEEIHWHTVKSEEPAREQPTRGMIGRLHPHVKHPGRRNARAQYG